jgi:MoaA/NifB/PqqE/SkfB family radical SAM enzyme
MGWKTLDENMSNSRYSERKSSLIDRVPIGKDGELHIPEEHRQRWGLLPGAEFMALETPEGLLLRPKDSPLTKVYVEPTTTCNLNCRTCIRNSWQEPGGTMDMATYRSLVDGLRGVPSLRTVAFWGFGEPLLHPHIVEMIALAKGLGARTELITNGLLLNREMAENLIMAGLDTLVVSVDGTTPKSYGEIRSGSDLGQVRENVQTLNTLRRLNSRQNPEIGIEFVLTRRNVSELPKLRSLAFSMEARFVVVTNVLPYTQDFKDEILYWLAAGDLSPPLRSKRFPEILLPRIDARPQYMEPLLELLWRVGAVDFLHTYMINGAGHCPFVWKGEAAVTWDGQVSPCVALMHSYGCYVMGREKFIRRYTIGNVVRDSITHIWNSQEYKEFRSRVLQFEFAPCVNCGGCYMAESNEEDCFGNVFPVCGDCLWARGIILCP